MKRKKIAVILSCLALSGAVLAGCGSNTQSTQSAAAQENQAQGDTQQANEQTPPDQNGGQESADGSITAYGRITEIDGQKITYTVGTLEMPQKGQDGQKPDGNPPEQNAQGGSSNQSDASAQGGSSDQNKAATDSSATDQNGAASGDSSSAQSSASGQDDQNGQKPDGQPPQDGQAPSGEKGEMPDLSDKLTLGEEKATVTVDTSIDISGLEKGDYITITQDADGNVTAVEEGIRPRMGGRPGGQRPDGNGSGQSENGSADAQSSQSTDGSSDSKSA